MKLLAFELATEACSVALWVDGEVRERHEVAPRRHAELALPWADALLADAGLARSQLDAIAVGQGPGAFTGVRLAVAIGQGIALALDRPMLPVSTLATLALRAPADATHIVAAIDARMGEVYVGAYGRSAGGPREALVLLAPERVLAPDAVRLPALQGQDASWDAVGTGFSVAGPAGPLAGRLHAQLATVAPGALPHASDLATLAAAAYLRGEALPPERVEPAYLRDNVALTLAEQIEARAAKARERGDSP